jgi:hypothetical protein
MQRLIVGIGICFLFMLFTHLAFSQTSGGISIQWGESSKQAPNGDGYKKKGGPPPHAPAHGYRAKHQYRYYPNRNVYYDQGRGLYFYVKGDGWAVGASLPGDLMANLGTSVNLELDTDKPFEHNSEHLKQYPRENYKPGKSAKR